LRNLIFWTLFPFALPQAVRLRRTAPRFSPPRCDTVGRYGSGAPLKVLAIGDSVIAGVGVDYLRDAFVGQTTRALAETLKRTVHWSVFGRSGARVEHLLAEYVQRLPDAPADVILLSVGVNDVTGLTLVPVWRRRLRQLLLTLRQHSPNAVIGIAGLPPMHAFPLLPEPLRFAAGQRGKAFDLVGRRLAGALPGVIHMPIEFETIDGSFCDDGFHPSARSYAVFGQRMAQLLAHDLSQTNRLPASAGLRSKPGSA